MHLSACPPVLLVNDLQNRTDEEDVAKPIDTAKKFC